MMKVTLAFLFFASTDASTFSEHSSIHPEKASSRRCAAEEQYKFNQLMTEVENSVAGIENNPNIEFLKVATTKEASMEAMKCLDLTTLTPDYSNMPAEFWCLPDYCESIETESACQAAFYQGCSYCSGRCVAAAGMQQAVINCVREAYKDAEPNKVNGIEPSQAQTSTAEEKTIFHSMAGLSDMKNVVGADASVRYWGIYQDSRPKDHRVPIHVHPLGGYTCVNKGPYTMTIEGVPTRTYNEGECFNTQQFTKMTQAPPHNDYTVTDYFHGNSCLPTWVVIEEDSYHIQDAQFGVESNYQCGAPDDASVHLDSTKQSNDSGAISLGGGIIVSCAIAAATALLAIA